MLWALIAIAIAGAIAGGAGGQDVLAEIETYWRKQIKKRLAKDPARRAKANAVISTYRADVDQLNAAIATHGDELRSVHRNYDSTLDDYEPLVAAAGEDVLTALNAFGQSSLDLREAMGAQNYEHAYADVRKEMVKYRKKRAKAEAKAAKKKNK